MCNAYGIILDIATILQKIDVLYFNLCDLIAVIST